MATTQSKSNPVADSVEAATERFADLNEKAIASSKRASEAYLSSYEKAVVALADSYEKATVATKIEWVASLGSLQADATREITAPTPARSASSSPKRRGWPRRTMPAAIRNQGSTHRVR